MSHTDPFNEITRRERRGLIGMVVAVVACILGTWSAVNQHNFYMWAMWGVATLGGFLFLISYWKVWRKWYIARLKTLIRFGDAQIAAHSGFVRWLRSRRVSGKRMGPTSLSILQRELSTLSGQTLSSAASVSGKGISHLPSGGRHRQSNRTDTEEIPVISILESLSDDTIYMHPLAAWEKELLLNDSRRKEKKRRDGNVR